MEPARIGGERLEVVALGSEPRSCSFMTPLFGVTFGVLLLGEPLTPVFGGGALLVLAGITTVSMAGQRRQAEGALPTAP